MESLVSLLGYVLAILNIFRTWIISFLGV